MRIRRVVLTVVIVVVPHVSPADAGPLTVKMPDGVVVTLLGVNTIDDGACAGQAQRAVSVHTPAKLERDPAIQDAAYVFDAMGKMLNEVALEWGCARVSAPSTAKRYGELTRAASLAQTMNRGRYAPQYSAAPPEANSAPLYTPGEPDALGSWYGSGSKDTESFTTSSREWRVRWNATPTSRVGGMLSVLVYNERGDLITTIDSGRLTDSRADQSFVRGAPGRYYLKIMSANCAWRIVAAQ